MNSQTNLEALSSLFVNAFIHWVFKMICHCIPFFDHLYILETFCLILSVFAAITTTLRLTITMEAILSTTSETLLISRVTDLLRDTAFSI